MKTDFIWMDGKMLPWDEAKIHVITHALHYGSGVFEGTRFYNTSEGPAIFRLSDHTKRLFFSASSLRLPINFTEEEVNEATKEVVRINKLESGYIRPLAFFGEGKMGLRPEGATPRLLIACWPWGKYLEDRPLRISISKYIRIHPKSLVTEAKVTGHYVNSILAVQDAVSDRGYDEALLLDYEGNLAEGPGENLFLVKDGVLHAPKTGSILPGITRQTVIQSAKEKFGIETIERTIHPDELWEADEAFYTGTAAEISPISSVDDRNIADGKEGEITKKIKDLYFRIVGGKEGKYNSWLTHIS